MMILVDLTIQDSNARNFGERLWMAREVLEKLICALEDSCVPLVDGASDMGAEQTRVSDFRCCFHRDVGLDQQAHTVEYAILQKVCSGLGVLETAKQINGNSGWLTVTLFV